MLRVRGKKAISIISNLNIFREEGRPEHKRSFIKWKIVYLVNLQDWAEGDNDKYQQLIDSDGEGRVSVARNQSFGRVLQQLWRSLSCP